MEYHVPALLNESIEGLNIQPGGVYVDLTFGGGGHSAAILSRLGKGRLIAFDQDEDAQRNKPVDSRFIFLSQNFRFLRNNLRMLGYDKVDGILADLGVSFYQFDEPGRGFSFRYDTPLDMRMNMKSKRNAATILNSYTPAELERIFRDYGELRNAARVAAAVVSAREKKPISTTGELVDAIGPLVPAKTENKFLARVFQAVRIEVNREIEYLMEMLGQGLAVLKTGGRFVVITYHSLEDRVVKNFFRTGNFEGHEEKDFYGNMIVPFRLVNRKVIVPTQDEIAINSRARSARLRVAEKI